MRLNLLTSLSAISSDKISNQKQSREFGNREALKEEDGFWETWTPWLADPALTNDRLDDLRSKGKLLVSTWGQWVESHHFLESERDTGGRLATDERQKTPSDDQAKEKISRLDSAGNC